MSLCPYRLLVRRWRPALAAGLACCLAVLPACAQSLDERLLADAADGKLDQVEFLPAALIASGVREQHELEQWARRYADLSEPDGTARSDARDAARRLARIHAALHERILVGDYQTEATDLRIALARGNFNCLSAAALYLDWCRVDGLELEVWLLPGHVCVRCPESDLGWLEPAVPELRRVLELDPGRKPPIRDGGTRVPSRRNIPPAARQISPVELLGKFYYNRGVQRLEEHQYAEGLALLRIALQLDPADLDARENLVAGLNNWAAQQCRAGSYGRAAELIEQGLALDAAFAPLVANQRLVKQKLASSVAFPRKP